MNHGRHRAPVEPRMDRAAPLRFLRVAFESQDWVGVFLKRYDTGDTTQRIVAVATVQRPQFQAWLRFMNADRFNIYVTVNALTSEQRSRRRDAVAAIRHIFLDV